MTILFFLETLVCAAGVSSLAAAGVARPPASRPATRPTTQTAAQAARLAALDADLTTSARGFRVLESLGPPGKTILRATAREVLSADKARILGAATTVGDPVKIRELETQLASVRQAAMENIAKLEKGEPVKVAQANYDKLTALTKQLQPYYAARLAVFDSMIRRKSLLATYRKSGPEEGAFPPPEEAKLPSLAEAALGASIDGLATKLAFGTGQPPEDRTVRGLWFYRACRRIEAYNRTMDRFQSAKEIQDVRDVNAYREALGLLPLEVDIRLTQSARRHSKEMVDLDYFAHQSPTPGLEEPSQRMAAAGYSGGFAENIAKFVRDPAYVFKLWFESPGHHKAWVIPGLTTIGVGKWDSAWTQHFGGGKRLMPQGETAGQEVTVKGMTLQPESDNADTGKPDTKIIIERRIYDPSNPDPSKRIRIEREERH